MSESANYSFIDGFGERHMVHGSVSAIHRLAEAFGRRDVLEHRQDMQMQAEREAIAHAVINADLDSIDMTLVAIRIRRGDFAATEPQGGSDGNART